MARRHMPKIKWDSRSLFDNWQQDLHAMYGEFVGSLLFFLFAFGAVQSVSTNLSLNSGSGNSAGGGTQVQGSDAARLAGLLYVSFGFGFSLAGVAFIFYRFTGSIFNPNVAFALMLCGVITPVRFALVALSEFVGSIVAAAILDGITPGNLTVGVALGFGTNRTQGLFMEAFGTFALVLAVLMLAAEKSRLTPFAPIGLGFLLFTLELYSVEYTGGAVNTARAFGPACFTGFQNYHWIYWLGPTMGAVAASAFYYMLRHIEYWKINPGQDSINHKHAAAAVEAALEEAEDAGITIDINDNVHGHGNGDAHSHAEAQTEQIGQRGNQEVYSQRLHSTSQPRVGA